MAAIFDNFQILTGLIILGPLLRRDNQVLCAINMHPTAGSNTFPLAMPLTRAVTVTREQRPVFRPFPSNTDLGEGS